MKQVDLMFRTMVAELQQRTFDAQWSADFPPTGRFVSVKVDNRSYWYFDQPDGKGGQKRRYVGPADDDEITIRVSVARCVPSTATSPRRGQLPRLRRLPASRGRRFPPNSPSRSGGPPLAYLRTGGSLLQDLCSAMRPSQSTKLQGATDTHRRAPSGTLFDKPLEHRRDHACVSPERTSRTTLSNAS